MLYCAATETLQLFLYWQQSLIVYTFFFTTTSSSSSTAVLQRRKSIREAEQQQRRQRWLVQLRFLYPLLPIPPPLPLSTHRLILVPHVTRECGGTTSSSFSSFFRFLLQPPTTATTQALSLFYLCYLCKRNRKGEVLDASAITRYQRYSLMQQPTTTTVA